MRYRIVLASAIVFTVAACGGGGASGESPACDMGPPLSLLPPEPSAAPGDDFVDPVTGHRIVRLSRLPNGGTSFYFTQNEFNCRGNKLVFGNAHGSLGRWLYSIDLETLDIQPIVKSDGGTPIMEVVAPKRNEVLHLDGDVTLQATNLDTYATRTIAQLPAGATGFTVNSDETLIAGFYNDGLADYQRQYPTTWVQQYYDAHRMSYLYTVDADSGAFKLIHQENNWLDHVQFSPSDPRLLMYAHEGPTDLVADRMWLIDVTGATAPRSLYTETDGALETVTHEFWSHDGTRVYFEHQVWTDASYFIAWVEVATGAMGGYPIAHADWGVHYAISHDGSMFATDGDPFPDSFSRKTLLLYRIVNGSLQVEPLADLSASDYSFQPNVHFTPDDKWVVYTEIKGTDVEVYAVSVAAGAIDLNQHGLTGSWYEPATNGQGAEIEVFPNLVAPGMGSVQVSWFTFDTVAGGADRQRWYTLSGPVMTGQPTASLKIYQNIGGNFNSPPNSNAVVVGTATLSFHACGSGQLSYTFTDGSGRSGMIPLSRITQNVTCSATGARPTNADFAFSGNWYNAATDGQGFVVEVNPLNGSVFMPWYTYAPGGAGAGAAGQRWYTASGAFTAGARSIALDIYETTGGVFDTHTVPGPTSVKVGTGALAFQSCSTANFSYNFTDGSSGGMSGLIALSRIGPVPAGCTF